MRILRHLLAAAIVAALAGRASAQSEVIGKVLDMDGKPVVGAEVTAANKTFPDRVFKSTTDKKGNYYVSGLMFEATAMAWIVSIKAPGFIPVSVKTVARDAQKNLYLSDDAKLNPAKPSKELSLKAFSEVRMEFTMRPGDAAAEANPLPTLPPPAAAGEAGAAAGAAAANDSFGEAVEKVRAGDAEGSVDLFKKAIEEKPDDWERRDVFAKVLLKLDRQGEATIQANKAAALAPDKVGPQLTLTDIYIARSLPDKATESIAKAQQLAPENSPEHTKVLERAAAVAASNGKIDDAIALTEKVVAAKPDNVDALVSLASLYNRNKQPKKAEEVLNKVVKVDPENAHRTFYNLGVITENRDDATEADHRKAIEAFKKAIELKPDYSIAHRDLGFALLRIGDLIGARKELQKYVDIDPKAKDAADIKATIKSLDSAK